MDLCAEQLASTLVAEHADALEVETVAPVLPRFARRLAPQARAALNADRLAGRFLTYPVHARRAASRFDLFHVVDHTYAPLLSALPPGRAGVFLHDLDAFRPVLEPERAPRPAWFRALARRQLEGLRRAAIVFHATRAVADEAVRLGAVSPERLVHAPLGPAPEFVAEPAAAPDSPRAGLRGAPYLLHVGSAAPRKRLDVLARVAGRLLHERPELRLVQVGAGAGALARAGLSSGPGTKVTTATGLSRAALADLYRHASLVLVPSEAEGFGLPLVEALACGAPLLVSALEVFREVGGDAVDFAPVGETEAWLAQARALVDGHGGRSRDERLAQARRFSWSAHAEAISAAYLSLWRRIREAT